MSFDDDRLASIDTTVLDALLDAHSRSYPRLRSKATVHWFLDEIQLLAGWERFVRRILDTERVEIVVSGASARMLSRKAGFPQAQGLSPSLRVELLQSYVDTVLFRDLVERHGITQVASGES
ncbi:MAG: AAA family ATPase [Betaproteobacteria bacterium]|nr:AAA family ATPase [Betaproteobacteria bacterium]